MNVLKTLCVLIFYILVTSFSYAAVLTASVNRNNIAIGQTFNLVINAQSDESNLNTPNLSALHKNFTVLGTARSQSLNIVNNKITRKDQWVISLIPKHAGRLTIPSITIGKDKTNTLSINVATTQTVKTNGKQSVFLDIKMTPKNPYINSEMIYQLKVFYDVNVGGASIVPPKSKNAIIKLLGQDQSYTTKIKGKTFQVFQRSFAVFPQKSGKIKLSPAIFRGQVSDKSSNIAYSGFYSLNTKPLQLVAPAITVNVKPVPKNIANKWWFPSSKVKLTEQWSHEQNQVDIGTPITRTLTLSAAGLMASQLPPLTTNNGKNYNSYGGQAQMENTLVGGHLVGSKTVKFVYIPTQKGKLVAPAISLKWWNVNTHKLETATLPVRDFKVVPGVINKPVETSEPTMASTKKLGSIAPTPITAKKTNDWIYIAMGLLILWLATLFIWYFSRRHKKMNVVEAKKPKSTGPISLKQACLDNNSQQVKSALLAWAQEKFKSDAIQNLSDVLKHIDDDTFAEQIELLQQKLYRQFDISWSGEQLWQCVKSFKLIKPKRNKDKKGLPKLNPE